MVVSNAKIYQKMKNQSLLSIKYEMKKKSLIKKNFINYLYLENLIYYLQLFLKE